jgi:hypothetical protein
MGRPGEGDLNPTGSGLEVGLKGAEFGGPPNGVDVGLCGKFGRFGFSVAMMVLI